MIVTRIEEVTKTKCKVYVEDEFAFVLYKGELSRYRLREGGEVSLELIKEIEKEVVLKRAKARVLYLLSNMDRTEEQIRTKLKTGYYKEEIIEQAIQYAKSFGYIDDNEYAIRYIRSRQNSKSKREIYVKLCQKGVGREEIEQAMNVCYDENEEIEAIRRLVEKKSFKACESEAERNRKVYAYLLRKGFKSEDIRQVIQVSFQNA